MKPVLNTYVVSVKFDSPEYTTLVIAAKTENEAKELTTHLLSGLKNVEIVDILDVQSAPVLAEYLGGQMNQQGNLH